MEEAIGEDVIDGDGGTLASSSATIDAADDNAGVSAFVTLAGGCVCDADGVAVAGVDGTAVVALPFTVPFVDSPFDVPVIADDTGDDVPFVGLEFATAAAYRIGGKAGFDPAVPGAPDNGKPDFRACDIGCVAKFGAGGNIGGGTFDESSVASANCD